MKIILESQIKFQMLSWILEYSGAAIITAPKRKDSFAFPSVSLWPLTPVVPSARKASPWRLSRGLQLFPVEGGGATEVHMLRRIGVYVWVCVSVCV